MGLFNKSKFVWAEPWFFCQRIRDRGDWFRATRLSIAACIGMLVLLAFARGGNMPAWQIILCGLGTGAVIQLGIEAAFMRRDITITEDSIEAFGNAGKFTSFAKHTLRDIIFLEIRRSEDIGFPFSMLVFRTATDGNVIGIPRSIRLERLAHTLHELKVPVTLSGWAPGTDVASDGNQYVYTAPERAALQTARIESIPEAQRNLTTVPDMLVALVLSAWPFFIWLGLIGWGCFAIYQNWQALSIWVVAACGIAMFISMLIPIGYFQIIGDYLSSNYLIRKAQGRVEARGESLIHSSNGRTLSVEQIRRETWAAMAPKVIDFGFLQVETQRQRIVFEGNLERWTVPFSAVKSCKIEEVQYGAGGEGTNSELRCFVALTIQKEDGPYEIGLRNADKDPGKNTDNRRMSKAVDLFDSLAVGFAT